MSNNNDAHIRLRILRNIEVVGDCWIWQRYIEPKGYGRCYVKGLGQLAHRVSYQVFVGPIPDGYELDHLCRERSCCNPDHLEPVTHDENMRRGHNATKTHCTRGHQLTGPNVRLLLRKGKHVRICRACERIRVDAYLRRKGKR